MSEFIQGAYNKEEHNHYEWPTERLEARIADIQHRMGMIAYSGERLAQVERELDLCALELACRYRDKRLGEMESDWNAKDEIKRRREDGTLDTN